MSDREDATGRQPHIAALRARAAHARRLAREVADKPAREGLLQYADEFERRAAELEARSAVLKESSLPEGPLGDIAALKPPDGGPKGDR